MTITRLNAQTGKPKVRATKPGAASLRAGGVILLVLLSLSLYGYLFLDDANSQDITSGNLPPFSDGHVLGTDVLGRDLLAWSAAGVATSLTVGVAVASISAVIGVLVGSLAGYLRGWVDTVLMRLVDLQLAVPPLLIFMAASVMIQRSVLTMVVLLSSVGWVPYARLVRATVLVERERGYIAAARLAGTRRTGIIIGHLVPATSTPIVVFASLQIGFVMLAEGALSFLGLGLEPPTASLGYMISQGRDQLAAAWWIATIPGLFMVLLIVAVNLVGDGLRDRFRLDQGGAA
ncbi:ABC transporter permease [Saccharomonospora sp. NPDC006951]